MADEIKVGGKIRAYCATCGGARNCEIKGHFPERGCDEIGIFSWSVDWLILVCCGCDYVFAQTISRNSEDLHYYYDLDGSEACEQIETISTWPAQSKREIPPWFTRSSIDTDIPDTEALEASLTELYGALDQDLVVLATIGVRTSFDIASEILGIKGNFSFRRKLDSLEANGHIAPVDREHLEVLVNAGSASAHRGWRPTVRELDALMTTLEAFIYNTMVAPAKRRAHEAEVAKVKESVPERRGK